MAMKSLSAEINQSSSAVSAAISSNSRSYNANVISNDSPVYYGGAETDSLKIDVDNESRVISGEVKWKSMIAMNEAQEDAYHAYPANKAKLAFKELRAELDSLASSVSNLDESCVNSVNKIMKYVDDLAAIQTELASCKTSLLDLTGKLNSERISREQADLKLRSSQTAAIEALNADMLQLTGMTQERLSAQDDQLSKNTLSISDESSRAVSAEEQLDKRVTALTKSLRQTDTSVQSMNLRVDSVNKRLTALETVEPNNMLDTHTEQLAELGKELGNLSLKSDNAISALKSTTTTLSDVVYKNSSTLTEIHNQLKHTKDIVADVKQGHAQQDAVILDLQKKHTEDQANHVRQYTMLANTVASESNIRRTADELHEQELARLEIRISNLQQNIYNIVQNLSEEFRAKDEELQETIEGARYSFIDGGNAPV